MASIKETWIISEILQLFFSITLYGCKPKQKKKQMLPR